MKLVLLDSHALVHRAYHAITRLSSPTGEPTNATYGFTNTLLKVLHEEQPDFIAAVFDVGKSFRDDLFAAYKAHRAELAADLQIQLARSRQIVEAMGIPVFGMAGYEADDLLGTLARQALERGIETIIVTGDTDTLQLVNPHVRVLMFTPQAGGGFTMYDEHAVVQRYHLAPPQLIDFKALKGDPSDNVPGVPGIGEKTATKLIQTYGSLEAVYAHLDEIEKRWQEKLRAGRALAEQSKKLVTIVTDAPIRFDPEMCRVSQLNLANALPLFRELGFRSVLERLAGAVSPVESAAPNGEHYHLVDTPATLDQLLVRLRTVPAFAFDVETTNTDPMRAELVGIAFGVGKGEAYYIPLVQPKAPTANRQNTAQLAFDMTAPIASSPSLDARYVLAQLEPIFMDEHRIKYAHNAKYDLTVLAEAGIPVRGLGFDSMIAAHLIESSIQSLGLKNLVLAKFGVSMTEIASLIGKGKRQVSLAEVDVAQVARYACADADYTYRLVEHYQPQLAERGVAELFYQVEMPLIPVLLEMERTGVLLDLDFLAHMSRELAQRLQALEKQIQAMVGAPINVASPMQLEDALFHKLGLPTTGLPKTKSGHISTAAGVLESLRDAHPIIPLILEHRELAKLKGTYVDALPALVHPRTGRVHTNYHQTGTVSGRISSSDPNLQNIPIRTELGRQVRRAFIAPRGSQLMSADYSQVELRILAHMAHDTELLAAFARGEDIHAATAARLFQVPLEQVTPAMRQLGKTINFGIVYGITDYGVAARTDLSQSEARQLIDSYFAQFAQVKEYIENTKRQAREQGYVQTLLGRRRYFPELQRWTQNVGARKAAEREAINHPIQGSAADIIKLAMIRLHRELHARGLKTRMILQVHDELVCECPDDEVELVAPLVRTVMEAAYPLASKLKVDVAIGQNWDEMKSR